MAQLFTKNTTIDTKVTSLYISILVREQSDQCSLIFDASCQQPRIRAIFSESIFLGVSFKTSKNTVHDDAKKIAATGGEDGIKKVVHL